jgi:hypothetical protein
MPTRAVIIGKPCVARLLRRLRKPWGIYALAAVVGVLLLSIVPVCAQPNTAKLRADAQNVVSNIRGDKAKTQAYCQINSLGGQMVEAAQEKDSKKAEALFQRVDDLEKQLGPQYRSLFDALYDADPNSKESALGKEAE